MLGESGILVVKITGCGAEEQILAKTRPTTSASSPIHRKGPMKMGSIAS
jgi:hypothetical protein